MLPADIWVTSIIRKANMLECLKKKKTHVILPAAIWNILWLSPLYVLRKLRLEGKNLAPDYTKSVSEPSESCLALIPELGFLGNVNNVINSQVTFCFTCLASAVLLVLYIPKTTYNLVWNSWATTFLGGNSPIGSSFNSCSSFLHRLYRFMHTIFVIPFWRFPALLL